MSNVNFKVNALRKAEKNGFVVAEITFDGSEKNYTYVRKYYTNKNDVHSIMIDGCKISFKNDLLGGFVFLNVERQYETKGVKKTDTSNISKGMAGKIKKEIEEQEIEVLKIPNVESGEVHHDRYEEIMMCLECNIPVYLAGPAGSCKNHTVEQIAKEKGWNFYFSNSVQQEYKLTGFIDAGGDFHETEFYKACTDEEECVFFLDEIDASIPEVLVLLNAAIANGYFEFPNGRVDFDHVHFVAAGNTVGNGADEMYTGRMVLDQATLDRFAIIEFDYCKRIEMAITKNNAELVEFIHQLRDEAEKKGIRATFSYRCLTMITKLEKSGMDLVMAIKISVVKGLDKDTINTLNPVGYSKYHKALKEIQKAA